MMTLDPALRSLVDDETLRHSSSGDGEHEYVIDAMRHVRQTGSGPEIIIYALRIQEDAEGEMYEIREETEYQGGQTIISTDDADEIAGWIEEGLSRE